jgi:hypothetical protein
MHEIGRGHDSVKKRRLFYPCKFDTILALGEALLSSGRLCRKNGTCLVNGDERPGFRDMRLRLETALTAVAASAVACAVLWPHARGAGALLAARDDPAALSDLQLNSALRNGADTIALNVEAALAANDADLASSFVELAAARNIPLSENLSRRVTEAVADQNSTSRVAKRFVTGLVTGEADDVASLSGTVAGDLFVFGDIRDVVREGKHLALGEEADRLVLGLAAAGLAVTAATYVSIGGATPLRAGLTLVKDARKVGRLGEGLTQWAGRSAREAVDTPMLQQAVATGSLLRPAETLGAIRAAFRAEKAGALVRLAKDAGRVGEKAGVRGALDALRIAEGPKDIARAARLAEAKGGQTRAIIKLLGRGALLLAVGAFDLTLWIFSALLALIGFLASIKATAERLTLVWLQRKKTRRLRRQTEARPALAVSVAHSQASRQFSQKSQEIRCRAFTTALLKLRISTKVPANPSFSFTASRRARM